MTTCSQQFNMPQMICGLETCSSVSHAAALYTSEALTVCLRPHACLTAWHDKKGGIMAGS